VSQLHHRACNLCEAICGLTIEHDGARVLSIRGDKDDPFSRGHVCPKALALTDLHEDPDRIRRPIRRDGTRWVEVGWDEAFADIGRRLRLLRGAHGHDAVALIQGNPVLHSYGAMIYAQILLPLALRSKNRFSSTSVDNLPRMLVSRWLYGNQAILPVPDVDRTDHLLVLGANPMASNGSVMTAPDLPHRLRAIQGRGGKIVVIDPRRTETAAMADRHHFIRPGRDAHLLLAMLHVLFREDRVRPTLEVRGLEALRTLAAPWAPERVAADTGIAAHAIVTLARELAEARRAVVYGRMGVSVQRHGALATWLVDVLNIVTGHLDREGGAMFTTPAVDLVGLASRMGLSGSFGGWKSRVRGLPEFNGELPMATLAEEIETPGPGQVRGAILVASNPVLSAPNGPRVERALAGLDLVVAVDPYLNETTRLAHYILPPTSALERDHYDLALHALGVRNTTRFSPALFAPPAGALHDWEILARLIGGLGGRLWARAVERVAQVITPKRITDALLRIGPHRLRLADVAAAEHGIDLGPLVPRRLAQLVRGPIDLAPRELLDDARRLAAPAPDGLLLIGRRDLRSNNSWMHNSHRLVKGRPRCTLHVHPDDAERHGLAHGGRARLSSTKGELLVPIEVTDAVMPGVVSLPHGWGHDRPGAKLGVAAAHAGVSMNDLTDENVVDELCGTAVVNGVPVVLAPG
jgi:anaerobic selenocysteine-containing dehydrogenase